MKNQAIQYLAFDVHQATVVASLRDESGKVVLRATMATEAKVILAFVKNAGPRVHVAFEEGTQAQWLHDLLIDHAEQVIVCNVRGRSEATNKSDRIDADALSEQLRLGALKPVFHGAPEILTLKELVRCYTALVEDSTRVMLRIKAIFRARAIPTPGVSVYRVSRRKQWLGEREGGAGGAATDLEGGHDRRRAPAAGLEDASIDPIPRPRASGPNPGDHAYAVPIPQQEEHLAVRGTGGGEAIERRSGVQERQTAAKQEGSDHTRAEPESPSAAQVRVQGRGHGGDSQARSTPRVLRSLARPRRERRVGEGHAGPQDRRRGPAST